MKSIKLYDSLKKTQLDYDSCGRSTINIYSCGPTVYDHSHIGHARSSITWDFIVRFLRSIGYTVVWTRNITDIDDKIINKSKDLKMHPDKVARIYSHSYHEDMINLNVDWPDYEPHATQYLSHMYSFIEKLIKKGAAYVIDSDVYFSIASFKHYGCLKGQPVEELEKGFGRVEPNPRKKHPLDFALWKGVKEENEYSFESPWGKGRPGWHLECSAMCDSLYGTNLDIHCGGDDLIFPHHENEIAQSEMASGPFARYWLHNGMIMVNGKKMAKSDGNFITIKEALKTTSGNAIRFFVLNSHYRMPLNYTEEGIQAAQNGINRLSEALSDINFNPYLITSIENDFIKEFNEVLSNDFNSPQALAILFKITDTINIEKNKNKKEELQKTLIVLSKILGFNLIDNNDISLKENTLSKLIDKLLGWRSDYKTKKEFENADKIRNLLKDSNIEIKDLPNNQIKWQIKL
jgi:cysteinyl-tRNA synthetase